MIEVRAASGSGIGPGAFTARRTRYSRTSFESRCAVFSAKPGSDFEVSHDEVRIRLAKLALKEPVTRLEALEPVDVGGCGDACATKCVGEAGGGLGGVRCFHCEYSIALYTQRGNRAHAVLLKQLCNEGRIENGACGVRNNSP